METAQPPPVITVSPLEITFTCSNCNSPLVAAGAAAGMTLDCQRCGKPTAVPTPVPPAAPSAEKIADLQRTLKENDSQRTEVTSYINQLSIQLHRWQLRLQTLNERKKELDTEMRKATA
jgi:hypothetical protein